MENARVITLRDREITQLYACLPTGQGLFCLSFLPRISGQLKHEAPHTILGCVRGEGDEVGNDRRETAVENSKKKTAERSKVSDGLK